MGSKTLMIQDDENDRHLRSSYLCLKVGAPGQRCRIRDFNRGICLTLTSSSTKISEPNSNCRT